MALPLVRLRGTLSVTRLFSISTLDVCQKSIPPPPLVRMLSPLWWTCMLRIAMSCAPLVKTTPK